MMAYQYPPMLSDNMPQQVIKLLDNGLSVTINLETDSPLRDEYFLWLDEGNTPDPAPEPELIPEPTAAEKLAASGLTVEELKSLLGLK